MYDSHSLCEGRFHILCLSFTLLIDRSQVNFLPWRAIHLGYRMHPGSPSERSFFLATILAPKHQVPLWVWLACTAILPVWSQPCIWVVAWHVASWAVLEIVMSSSVEASDGGQCWSYWWCSQQLATHAAWAHFPPCGVKGENFWAGKVESSLYAATRSNGPFSGPSCVIMFPHGQKRVKWVIKYLTYIT